MRSFLFPAFSKAFLRRSQTTTRVRREVSAGRAASQPKFLLQTSRAYCRLCREETAELFPLSFRQWPPSPACRRSREPPPRSLLPSNRGTRRPLTRQQHLLHREHPTGTERKSLTQECGWKGGDRGGLAEREKVKKTEERVKKLLTWIGLLMEGLESTCA